MTYAERIKELAPQYDPSDVEAWIRVEYPTLDWMDAKRLAKEVKEAVANIRLATPDMTARLRKSFGL